MNRVKPYAKAVVGAAIAFTGAVAVGYADGAMIAAEWWAAASSGLVAFGAVFGVPNAGAAGDSGEGA